MLTNGHMYQKAESQLVTPEILSLSQLSASYKLVGHTWHKIIRPVTSQLLLGGKTGSSVVVLVTPSHIRRDMVTPGHH